MASLSALSAQQISKMLDEYGIKHGPVVDSTRSLYERKLKEAMSKEKRGKTTSDKTFYREEEEEVTYVYRTPVRSEGAGDSESYLRSRPDWREESQQEPSLSSYSGSRPTYRGKDYGDEPSLSSYSGSRPTYRGQDYANEPSHSSYSGSRPTYRGQDYANEPYMYDSPSTYRHSYLKSTPVKPSEKAPEPAKSSSLIPVWVQIVVFLVVAVFLYVVFSTMETNEPFKLD